jgi:hypothetical protein
MDGQMAIAAERSPSLEVVPSVSLDAGVTWTPRPPLPFPNILTVEPWVAGDAASFVITYWPSCCSPTLTACYRTLDRGARWTAFPQWLSGAYQWQSVPLDDGLLHVFGRGYPPVVAQFDVGYQPYGVATAGAGAIEPELQGHGVPTLGNTVGVSMTAARGGSVAAFAFSFAGLANQSFGNATILVAQPTSTHFFVTTGGPGTAGSGAGLLQVPIPNQQAFLGLHVWLQGFVLDPASSAGVAASAGLEMVVR